MDQVAFLAQVFHCLVTKRIERKLQAVVHMCIRKKNQGAIQSIKECPEAQKYSAVFSRVL
jgi:hypothetical protein